MTSKANIYFRVSIDNNTFYARESDSKDQPHGLAFATLTSIETILSQGLVYSPLHHDSFSKLTHEELTNTLKKRSLSILEGYQSKISNYSWIRKRLFTDEDRLKKIVKRIDQLVNPPPFLPELPAELVQKVLGYLPHQDLAEVSMINHTAQTHTNTQLLKTARRLGYDGDEKDVRAFMREFNEEINDFVERRFLHIEKNETDLEKILNSIDSSKILYFFAYMNYKKPHTRRYFLTIAKQNINKWKETKYNENLLEFGISNTIEKKDKEVLEIFLQVGAKPEGPEWSPIGPPLHEATDRQFIDGIELLVNYGANINQLDQKGRTALHCACGSNTHWYSEPSAQVAKFLLEQGADPNISNRNGYTPLHQAISSLTPSDQESIVAALLASPRTDINALNYFHFTPLALACTGYQRGYVKEPDFTLISQLLNAGANPHISPPGYATLLDLARKGGADEQVLNLIRSALQDK